MTTTTISPLRRRMIEDMDARKLVAGTQKGHLRSCEHFARFLGRSPDGATPEDVRRFQVHLAESGRLIYTTNAIESLHRSLRKIIKTRGHFPNDQAASKLLYLAIRNIEKGWKAAPKEWLPALNQFDILFGDRLRADN